MTGRAARGWARPAGSPVCTARRPVGAPVCSERRPAGSPVCSERRPVGDRGAVAVVLVALAAVLALAGMTASALAAVAVARQRAAAVADLAALAAAQHAQEGRQVACGWAGRIAAGDGGRVRSCVMHGDVAEVVVEVRPPGRLGELGSATSRARAGPVRGWLSGTS